MKKGFTLVEIIISIGIIIFVGVTSIVGFNVVKKNHKESTLENMSDKILTAVNVYVETNSEVKDELYKNKNGLVIPLTTLENAGLVDFDNMELNDDEDYVVTMLGSTEENSDHCAENYTETSWNIKSGEIIYICEKSNSEIEELKKELEEIKKSLNGSSGNTNQTIKKEMFFEDLTYTFKGENPNNYVEFDVESDDSKFAYFPDNNDLWRIVTIDADNKIQLIYSAPVKSNNFNNYITTKSSQLSCSCYAGTVVQTAEQCTYYELNSKTESGTYFRYTSNDGFLGTEIIQKESVSGSKKKELFDAIVNNAWIVESKYFPYYQSHTTSNIHLPSSSIELKIGMLDPNIINSSVNIGTSWLYNYPSVMGTKSYDNDSYVAQYNIYNNGGVISHEVRAQYGTKCSGTINSSYRILYTKDYYPIIVLNSKVSLVVPTCEEGKVVGSQDCPYKLKCSEC